MTDAAVSADGFVVDPADNVATLIRPARAGEDVRLAGAAQAGHIRLADDIAEGHKCALSDIPDGAEVVKYGVAIGRANQAISRGQHVHVHNVDSKFSPATDPQPTPPATESRIAPGALHDLVTEAMRQAGASAQAAQDFAAHCVQAERSGVGTHGIRRLPNYLTRLRSSGVNGAAEPRISGDQGVLSVDGCNGVGHHVARIAADAVSERAKQFGVAVALVRNSNHFGYAGYYAARIAEQGAVGMVISNGQVLMGPPGAKQAIFSNNPIAIAAPRASGGLFEFDMAMSVTSRANVARAAETGRSIAEGIALDAEGRPTTDAAAALAGILLPMGGARGFGLTAALEVLTGILPGGAYADQVASKEAQPDRGEGTSHFLLAIDLDHCGGTEAFTARLEDLADRVAGLDMRSGALPGRLPGARRAQARAEAARRGIALDAQARAILETLAEQTGSRLELIEEASS